MSTARGSHLLRSKRTLQMPWCIHLTGSSQWTCHPSPPCTSQAPPVTLPKGRQAASLWIGFCRGPLASLRSLVALCQGQIGACHWHCAMPARPPIYILQEQSLIYETADKLMKTDGLCALWMAHHRPVEQLARLPGGPCLPSSSHHHTACHWFNTFKRKDVFLLSPCSVSSLFCCLLTPLMEHLFSVRREEY